MAKKLCIALCLCLLVSSRLWGQIALPAPINPTSAISHSGQFHAQVLRPKQVTSVQSQKTARVAMAGTWATLILPGAPPRSSDAPQHLDPALLVASCERMKKEVLDELGMPDQWRGKIDLNINSTLPEDAEPLLIAITTPQGWRYELELPADIKTDRLTRSLVHVVLLEIANRSNPPESARVPFWLVEGIMAQIQSSISPTLLLQPNLTSLGERNVLSAADRLRFRFRARAPLTFQELSWPSEDQFADKEEPFYRISAQLLVFELLRLKEGRACTSHFLAQLPQRLNWQVAFLDAFQPYFRTLLDVEKWWGLTALSVSGRSLAELWTEQESGEKFQEALAIPVRVHSDANRLPDAASVPLQEVILRWSPSMQKVTLQKAIANLASMRPNLAPQFAPLLDEYCRVLNTYLNTHAPKYLSWVKADNTSPRFQQATCTQLSALDQQLAALRVKLAAVPPPVQPAEPVQVSNLQGTTTETVR